MPRMTGQTLIDSDVLIWLARGHPGAARHLSTIRPWRISIITYMELAQGCRNKTELGRLKKGLTARATEVHPLTPAISMYAAELIDSLALSHGLRLADALIAATALEQGLTLLSANVRHFEPVTGLDLEAFHPASVD
ncbi:type II toxin-antitoxin system VapC family toxin [Curvibacter gracilis]|uniref:type II toxin-antitoxin system VapC family toxin n=1 Tax=Curvibacter gracilis TaxID=230310 RepID=UPI00316AC1D1